MFSEDNDLELKPEGEVIPDAEVAADENTETEELPVEASEAEAVDSVEPEAETESEPAEPLQE